MSLTDDVYFYENVHQDGRIKCSSEFSYFTKFNLFTHIDISATISCLLKRWYAMATKLTHM